MERPALQRVPDWRPRLVAWLAEVARKPFRPGEHDCALFAAGAIATMTGTDPAAKYRGRYTTVPGGLRILRRDGFADHVALVTGLLEEIPPLMAQVGDLAVVPTPEGPALGVVAGAEVLVLRPEGQGAVSLMAVERAFKLPSGGY
jgi:hypothetical protein